MTPPSLGPHGEGWVALQFVWLGVIGAAAYLAPSEGPGAASDGALLVGSVLVLVGAAIALWAVAILRSASALTALPHPREGARLVDGGPYRLVRHPIYAALIVAAIGATLARASVAAGAATLALAVTLDLKRRREELWLAERFQGYAAYRQRTKALIPFLY